MKTSASLLTLFLLLAGCSSIGPAGVVWTSDDRQVTVFASDGMATDSRTYLFDRSTRSLSGKWKELFQDEKHSELLLSSDQAAQLMELLARVRLESTHNGGCANDAPVMGLHVMKSSGETRHYDTRPELNDCGSPRTFAVEEDVQAVLDACTALLPAPSP
ncbi:hypothetical protein [Archangium sp.]|uniref:hypothetical protein n=1 Tax=Archangium sp. TaxID=1872627 RepID=UPI00389AF270